MCVSMSCKLPYGEFEWVNGTDNKAYVLEVDLEYPNELRELHNDYPLACEHRGASLCKLWTKFTQVYTGLPKLPLSKLFGHF